MRDARIEVPVLMFPVDIASEPLEDEQIEAPVLVIPESILP